MRSQAGPVISPSDPATRYDPGFVQRASTLLVLLTLALLQLPWVFCPCEDCGGFAPITGGVACLDDHDHSHDDHGHSHDDCDHEHDEQHQHAVTMLAVVQCAGAVVLDDAPTSGLRLHLLVAVDEAVTVDGCVTEVRTVPWDIRPASAMPAAGQRLLL